MAITAPFGTWKSPIKASMIAAQSQYGGIEEIILDSITSKIYFGQKRPAENGRSAIVDASDLQDMFSSRWDARSRVHGYGGAPALVHDGILYFSYIKDDRVYKTVKGGEPVAVTPADNGIRRYADFTPHPLHPHLLVSICEDHTNSLPKEVKNYLVVIDTKSSTATQITAGADFYACPRFSPDGRHLVWQEWCHPDMPYQSSIIKFAPVTITPSSSDEHLTLGDSTHIGGSPQAGICAQDPIWASSDTIIFFSDISGFQNPFQYAISNTKTNEKATPLLSEPISEEFGAPQWLLSRHCSGALSPTKVVVTSFRDGQSVLYLFDLASNTHIEIPTPFAHIQFMRGDGQGHVVFLGQPPDSGEVITSLTLSPSTSEPILTYINPPPPHPIPSTYISTPQYHALTLSPDNRICHVNFYPPKNPNYTAVEGEKPPVIVWVHGGPYFMEYANLDWSKQFWTSRGWARLEVNYSGSTGFGRAYRERLNGRWGILDIQDIYQSLLSLGSLGLLDPNRAVITGQSAGGYASLQSATTLQSLFPSLTPPSFYKAAMPRYGVSELRKMDVQLHKLQCCMLNTALGKWEDKKDVWHERSPIYHADKIRIPMLIMMGKNDPFIPVAQMSDMVDLIKSHNIKCDFIAFEGEGHGWRKSKTIRTVLERELAFLGEIFEFDNEP